MRLGFAMVLSRELGIGVPIAKGRFRVQVCRQCALEGSHCDMSLLIPWIYVQCNVDGSLLMESRSLSIKVGELQISRDSNNASLTSGKKLKLGQEPPNGRRSLCIEKKEYSQ